MKKRGHRWKHGHSGKGAMSPTYISWKDMISRCHNQNNKRWSRYGGRGIKVCRRWREFTGFLADMGERQKGLTLERINNDGDYKPSNCRWATRAEQNYNHSGVVFITFMGKRMCMEEWAKAIKIKQRTLHARLRDYGWSVKRALTEPVQKRTFTPRAQP